MARPRKPTNLLVLSGSIEHDKKRYVNRTSEPKAKRKLGTPPKHLSPDLKAVWNELVRQTPSGVLTSADRIILELAVRLTAKMRTGEMSTGESSQLISCLSRLGLTPADRSRVAVDPALASPLVESNKFAKFA